MRFLFSVVLLLVLAAVSAQAYMTEKEYQDEFVRFVKAFSKQYEPEELFYRYAVFKSNLDVINFYNSNPSHTSRQGVHFYSDLTSAEMKSKLNGYRRTHRPNKATPMPYMVSGLPASLNWVEKGAVTPIKNQGECGSCWSFSATGAVEGAHFLSTGSLVSVSEQQLVDCSTSEGDNGCGGGLMDDAFQYIVDNHGICSEASYPYKAVQGKCQTTCKKVVTISSFQDVIAGNETDLLVHAAQQPISVAIEADTAMFQNYQSGVLNDTSCGTDLDHGVLVVGYGHDATTGLDYWLVKNSWGVSWGDKGFIKIARGSNMCGIALDPSFPIA